MSSGPSWFADDDRLLDELGAAVRAPSEVPERIVMTGRAAFAWRTVEADLARLVHDSSAHPEPAGMRTSGADGPDAVRRLSLANGDLLIELEIHLDAVRGQVVPPGPGTVLLRDEAGAVRTVTIDEVGWFVARPAPAGPFQLMVRPEGRAAVVTEWISPRPG